MFNLCSDLLSRAAAGAGGRCPVSDHYYQPIQIINTTWITEHAVFNKWTSARFHATCVRAAVKSLRLESQTSNIFVSDCKLRSAKVQIRLLRKRTIIIQDCGYGRSVRWTPPVGVPMSTAQLVRTHSRLYGALGSVICAPCDNISNVRQLSCESAASVACSPFRSVGRG